MPIILVSERTGTLLRPGTSYVQWWLDGLYPLSLSRYSLGSNDESENGRHMVDVLYQHGHTYLGRVSTSQIGSY